MSRPSCAPSSSRNQAAGRRPRGRASRSNCRSPRRRERAPTTLGVAQPDDRRLEAGHDRLNAVWSAAVVLQIGIGQGMRHLEMAVAARQSTPARAGRSTGSGRNTNALTIGEYARRAADPDGEASDRPRPANPGARRRMRAGHSATSWRRRCSVLQGRGGQDVLHRFAPQIGAAPSQTAASRAAARETPVPSRGRGRRGTRTAAAAAACGRQAIR